MAGCKVLVVEDENLIAMDLQRRLEGLGYSVTGTAGTGEAAMRLAKATHPDIVLMDIVLRGPVDGIELSAGMRSELDIPVVYVTAHSDEKTVSRAKATGPYGYVTKPVDDRQLQIFVDIAFRHTGAGKLLLCVHAGRGASPSAAWRAHEGGESSAPAVGGAAGPAADGDAAPVPACEPDRIAASVRSALAKAAEQYGGEEHFVLMDDLSSMEFYAGAETVRRFSAGLFGGLSGLGIFPFVVLPDGKSHLLGPAPLSARRRLRIEGAWLAGT
jgi:CheY-like chemotaxis protein